MLACSRHGARIGICKEAKETRREQVLCTSDKQTGRREGDNVGRKASNASSPRWTDKGKETVAIQKTCQTTRRAERQHPSGGAGTR